MRLKILPPTLREKKRYIGFDLYSQQPLDEEKVKTIIWRACINVYGEIETSKINPWFVSIKEVKDSYKTQHKCILKCRRGYEKKMLIVLNSVYRYKDSRIVIHTLGISGTIKTLTKKYDLP